MNIKCYLFLLLLAIVLVSASCADMKRREFYEKTVWAEVSLKVGQESEIIHLKVLHLDLNEGRVKIRVDDKRQMIAKKGDFIESDVLGLYQVRLKDISTKDKKAIFEYVEKVEWGGR